MTKRLIVFSGFSGAIAVALGALGAHFLKGKVALGILTLANLQAFETGVKFQMYHSIALLVIALLAKHKVHEGLLALVHNCNYARDQKWICTSVCISCVITIILLHIAMLNVIL